MISSTQQYQTSIVGRSRRIYIRAVIDISDPDMVIDGVTATSEAPVSKPEELYDHVFENPSRYTTLERNRWLLDGTFNIFPDSYQTTDRIGFVGGARSGDDGTFSTPQAVELAFSNVSILQAFSVVFSGDELDGLAEDFTVEVLYNGTSYFSQSFTGNREAKIDLSGFTVYNPTSIKVNITKWSLPGRRVRMVQIVPGVYEEWSEKMLASFDATHQADFSCVSIPFGTVNLSMNNKSRRFEPRSKNGVFQSIEERQGVEIYIGVRLPDRTVEWKQLGVFYQSGDGWKTGDNSLSMSWALVDIVGLLADRTFLPPETLPTTLGGWVGALAAQLGDNFADRWHVDPDYSGLSVTANNREAVTGKTCGDILRWACMVTGTWPRADAETGNLTAEPLWSQGNKVNLTELVNYPTMMANSSIAALIFTLADGNNTQIVVSGNATSAETTVSVENPFIHTQAQALTAARLILSCYGGNVIETTGRGDPSSEIGDVDTIWLDESSAITARRKMQRFSFTDGVMQNCVSQLLQADGSFLFEERAVITGSGTWTAPAGVTQLRLILVGKGGDGQAGTDGSFDAPGTDGADGVGGQVWAGTVNINPQQVFQVSIGQDTVFGQYSSANGRVYAYGYTDVASGSSYGRTGVQAPVPGSGDGGAGGQGGSQGARHRETSYGPDGRPNGSHMVVDVEPGIGEPGVAGATGCAVVYWDKEDGA